MDLQTVNAHFEPETASSKMNMESVRQYILSVLLNEATVCIESDQDLLLSGLLDSLNVIRLVTHIENECNLTIPPEDVVLENFNSLNDIARYINARCD